MLPWYGGGQGSCGNPASCRSRLFCSPTLLVVLRYGMHRASGRRGTGSWVSGAVVWEGSVSVGFMRNLSRAFQMVMLVSHVGGVFRSPLVNRVGKFVPSFAFLFSLSGSSEPNSVLAFVEVSSRGKMCLSFQSLEVGGKEAYELGQCPKGRTWKI